MWEDVCDHILAKVTEEHLQHHESIYDVLPNLMIPNLEPVPVRLVD